MKMHLRLSFTVTLFILFLTGCAVTPGHEPESTETTTSEESQIWEERLALVREGGLVLEEMSALELLDTLVYAATTLDNDEPAETAVVIEAHQRTILETQQRTPWGYITEDEIPLLLERLDSERPAIGVASEIAENMPGITTESRQAAFLIQGYRTRHYPPTESSDWLYYDPQHFRVWWKVYTEDIRECDPYDGSKELPLSPEARRAEELDIMETLIWPSLYGRQANRDRPDYYFFIAIDDYKDPPKEFLERFAGHKPPVKPDSALDDLEYDPGNLDRGYAVPGRRILVRDLEWITPNCVEVYKDSYAGPLRAAGGTYRLRKIEGRWIVIKTIDSWLS